MSLESIGTHYSKLRCDAICALRTPAVKGCISITDAQFLHQRILRKSPSNVVEIGTCAGFSTAVIGDALTLLRIVHGDPRHLLSYDNSETCFYDRKLKVGHFLQSITWDIHSSITLRTGCTSWNMREDIARGALEYLFIDASHSHPWPCLDLWVALPYLSDDAEVCLHDINLPLVNPNYPTYGAMYLFEALSMEKHYADPMPGRVTNMGSVTFSGNKEKARDEILACINDHPWEGKVDRAWLDTVGILSDIKAAFDANMARLGP